MEYKTLVVHEFFVGSDELTITINDLLHQWGQTEVGKWVLAHAVEPPVWHRFDNPDMFGSKILVAAKLAGKDYTFWQLKWGS